MSQLRVIWQALMDAYVQRTTMGMTYDDDPWSARSMLYDRCRTWFGRLWGQEL